MFKDRIHREFIFSFQESLLALFSKKLVFSQNQIFNLVIKTYSLPFLNIKYLKTQFLVNSQLVALNTRRMHGVDASQ